MPPEDTPDQCPHCGTATSGRSRCLNCGQSFDSFAVSRPDDTTSAPTEPHPTGDGLDRRTLLAGLGGSALVLGAGGAGWWVLRDSDQPADANSEWMPFGLVASDATSTRTRLRGRVDVNTLSGYDVVDHVGIVNGNGRVKLSVRVRNVGTETVQLTTQHNVSVALYDTDEEKLVEFGPTRTETESGQTTILDYLGPVTSALESDLGRYGLTLNCAGIDPDDRSPYCPAE